MTAQEIQAILNEYPLGLEVAIPSQGVMAGCIVDRVDPETYRARTTNFVWVDVSLLVPIAPVKA